MVLVGVFAVERLLAGVTCLLEGSLRGGSGGTGFGSENLLVEGFLGDRRKGSDAALCVVKTTKWCEQRAG